MPLRLRGRWALCLVCLTAGCGWQIIPPLVLSLNSETASDAGGGPVTVADAGPALVDAGPADAGPIDAGLPCQESSAEGKCLQVLASNQTISGIAVDDSRVYWTDVGTFDAATGLSNGDGAVMSIPKGGGIATALASCQLSPAALSIDSQSIYWTEDDPNGAVVQAPLTGGALVTLASGVYTPGAIAAANGAVYYVIADSLIEEVDVSTGEGTALGSDLQTVLSVAPDETDVYATSIDAVDGGLVGSVLALPLDGGSPVTLAPAGQGALQVVTDSGRVYWLQVDTGWEGSVVGIAKSGGTPLTLASSQENPASVATDGVFVYWAVVSSMPTVWAISSRSRTLTQGSPCASPPPSRTTTEKAAEMTINSMGRWRLASAIALLVAQTGARGMAQPVGPTSDDDVFLDESGFNVLCEEQAASIYVSRLEVAPPGVHQEMFRAIEVIRGAPVSEVPPWPAFRHPRRPRVGETRLSVVLKSGEECETCIYRPGSSPGCGRRIRYLRANEQFLRLREGGLTDILVKYLTSADEYDITLASNEIETAGGQPDGRAGIDWDVIGDTVTRLLQKQPLGWMAVRRSGPQTDYLRVAATAVRVIREQRTADRLPAPGWWGLAAEIMLSEDVCGTLTDMGYVTDCVLVPIPGTKSQRTSVSGADRIRIERALSADRKGPEAVASVRRAATPEERRNSLLHLAEQLDQCGGGYPDTRVPGAWWPDAERLLLPSLKSDDGRLRFAACRAFLAAGFRATCGTVNSPGPSADETTAIRDLVIKGVAK